MPTWVFLEKVNPSVGFADSSLYTREPLRRIDFVVGMYKKAGGGL